MPAKTNANDYRYNYIINNPARIRVLYLITLISWGFAMVGLGKFFDLSIWYWFILLPIFLPSLYSRTVSYFVNVFYPGFNLQEHEKKKTEFWANNHPTVDVFLPIAGEDVEILKQTWQAVAKLDYDNYQVYVLEDKVDLKARKLASEIGFNYLSRPNKGEYKKAGNLKYGYENSNGEFVVILDADFVPHKSFIKEALPYFNNPSIGIVQTPQYFETSDEIHQRSAIEFGAGNVVEDFYRIVQPSRDFFGAAICVGTNSVFRRKAVFDAHAPHLVERSEDVVSGLTLLKYNYELKYIPLILAKGICPDNIENYFKQHNRWCTGSVMLLFSSFFWRIKMTNLQRIIFSSGPVYYLAEAFSLLVSIQLFLLLFFHADTIALGHILWFLPHLIMRRLVLPRTKRVRSRRGTLLAALTHVYTYAFSIYTIVAGSTLEWVPTNIKTSGVSGTFKIAVWINRFFLGFWGVMAGIIFLRRPLLWQNPDAWVLLFWLAYSFLVHGYFFWAASRYIAAKSVPVTAEQPKIVEAPAAPAQTTVTPTPKVNLPLTGDLVQAQASASEGSTVLYRLAINLLVFAAVFFATSAVLFTTQGGNLEFELSNLTLPSLG